MAAERTPVKMGDLHAMCLFPLRLSLLTPAPLASSPQPVKAERTPAKKGEVCTRGLNYGGLELSGDTVRFTCDDQMVFEFPYVAVSQCTVQGKNEVRGGERKQDE